MAQQRPGRGAGEGVVFPGLYIISESIPVGGATRVGQTMDDTTKRRTLSDDVLNTLRERIVSGELEAGAPLRQNTLAKELSVSPIPIREALLQLEAEGLAVSKPHHGSVVASLSLEDITEVFELRTYLEVPLLRKAVSHMTARTLSEAK